MRNDEINTVFWRQTPKINLELVVRILDGLRIAKEDYTFRGPYEKNQWIMFVRFTGPNKLADKVMLLALNQMIVLNQAGDTYTVFPEK